MFRRFMIVCWVLFLVGATFTASAGIGFLYYGEKIEEIESSWIDKDSVTSLPDGFVLDRPRNIYNDLDPLWRRLAAYRNAMHIGFAVATLILLWNIVWHIGHWVWMGRKVE